MSEDITTGQLIQTNHNGSGELIDLRKTILNVIQYKYFFLGSIIITLILAYLYNTYTIKVYRSSAATLIEQDKKTTSTGNDQLLEGFGLMPGAKNLDNQIMVLSSRSLVSKTLDELSVNVIYYYRGLINKKSLYPYEPINIITDPGTTLPRDLEFSFKFLGNNMFRLDAESKDLFAIHVKAYFGDKIEYPGGSFTIERNEPGWFKGDVNRKLYFIFPSHRNLVSDYIKRLKIEPVTKKGSIVKITITGTNKEEDLVFLNKYCETFLNLSLDKKNNEASRIIQFIDDQLVGVSDSLLTTENNLQKFRSKNRVMNISMQGQAIIDQAMNLENQKARLALESGYYDHLTEYLEKGDVGAVPIAPATMGISDPGLTKLVSDLADLQGRLYGKGMSEKNPLQSQLEQKVQSTKEALKETIKVMSRANKLAIAENQQQINSINAQASVLPKTERELLGIERKYKLNDELFTFLLQKRALALMQKASNVADNELVDYPETENTPVSPNKPLIYLAAVVLGIGIPGLWLFFAGMFSIRIKELEEINKITDIPVTGFIPHSIIKKYTQVLDDPDSPVTEAFRLLRSKMGFFTKDIKSPVILITSSVPNEGKTFAAINLASAYSLLGKKTVLVGFDLRKPKIYSDFGLDNEHGVSTWLIGEDSLEDIIKTTPYSNLHIITSGPVPPNPSELTTMNKTDELIQLLRNNYDCIIIDSSPVGIVSDTYHLATLSDSCILVARQFVTIRELFAETAKELKKSKIKGLNILINDVISNSRRYAYGGKYKYNYNNKKSKNVTDRGHSETDKSSGNRKDSSKIIQTIITENRINLL